MSKNSLKNNLKIDQEKWPDTSEFTGLKTRYSQLLHSIKDLLGDAIPYRDLPILVHVAFVEVSDGKVSDGKVAERKLPRGANTESYAGLKRTIQMAPPLIPHSREKEIRLFNYC